MALGRKFDVSYIYWSKRLGSTKVKLEIAVRWGNCVGRVIARVVIIANYSCPKLNASEVPEVPQIHPRSKKDSPSVFWGSRLLRALNAERRGLRASGWPPPAALSRGSSRTDENTRPTWNSQTVQSAYISINLTSNITSLFARCHFQHNLDFRKV